MKAKIRTIAAICQLCSLCGIHSVNAAEDSQLDVTGGLSLSQKSMELVIRDRTFEPNFFSLGFTLTAGVKRIYLSVNHDESIKDDIETDPNGLIFYSRTDTSIEVNYLYSDELRFSVGYRFGETDSHYSFTNDAFGTTEKGYFVGGTYAWGFGRIGTLSANLAIADLDGEVSLREPFVDTSAFVVGPPPPDNIVGSALGYSLSVVWTGLLAENNFYSIGARLHRYEFEDDEVFGGLDLSYEQNFTILFLNLLHQFN